MNPQLFIAAFALAYPLALMGSLGVEKFMHAIDVYWHISDRME
ncbi:Uncharacterised protein [Mycobacteroides abscessus]|nr:Uncharacterised protein [Mycobacteroides abscessus]CPW85551.1 Uncharacterised protein [Mycobacteroides abscessus]SKU89252.1 Uncharacterised protein [Mycobacteroides abscessus subsp. massiliense]SKU97472.1 Uncharacterised protein [Mycobacteroides abscessus subsp. massiliense]